MHVATGVVDLTNVSILYVWHCARQDKRSIKLMCLTVCIGMLLYRICVGGLCERCFVRANVYGGIYVCVGLKSILFPCKSWYECMWLFFVVV